MGAEIIIILCTVIPAAIVIGLTIGCAYCIFYGCLICQDDDDTKTKPAKTAKPKTLSAAEAAALEVTIV